MVDVISIPSQVYSINLEYIVPLVGPLQMGSLYAPFRMGYVLAFSIEKKKKNTILMTFYSLFYVYSCSFTYSPVGIMSL